MMKKRVVALALIAAWLLSSAALAADATPPDWLNTRPEDEAETGQDGPETEDTEETEKPEEPGETSGSILISGQHTAYISGSGGQFRPCGCKSDPRGQNRTPAGNPVPDPHCGAV